MPPRTESLPSTLAVLIALAALAGLTVGIAAALVAWLGIGSTLASFVAASAVAGGLLIYGACYEIWARTFWGAPFDVGDRVRIVRGPGANTEATVVELGQGVEVEVEYDQGGERRRRRLTWAQLRRIGPASADERRAHGDPR